jgi:hypothetical protein
MRIRGLCILALPIAVAMAACTTPTDQDADEQDEGPVQSTYRVQGSDMGRSWQNIVVQRDGVGLAGAEVRVNGTLIPDWPDVAGEYYGSIPIVDSGAVLKLEVRSGDDVVEAIGVVPPAPVLASPADGAVFVKGTPVPVEWTSSVDPERFLVWASWSCGTGCGTGTTYEVDGADRTFTIPAADLPDDLPVVIEVTGYNDGVFSGPVTADSEMSIRGEGPSESVITMSTAVYRIMGSDMSGGYQNVFVYRNDSLLSAAVVQVNGVAMVETQTGLYSGQVPLVPAGEVVEVRVRNGADEVVGTGRVPEEAVLTAPTAGAAFGSTQQITVSWTSATSPDRFRMYALYSCGAGCGTSKTYDVAGTARTLTFPAADLPVNEPVTITMFAYNDGAFTGPVSSDSQMRIRALTTSQAVITITP